MCIADYKLKLQRKWNRGNDRLVFIIRSYVF